LFHLHRSCEQEDLWRWNGHGVPKRRNINSRRRGITQKKEYNNISNLFQSSFPYEKCPKPTNYWKLLARDCEPESPASQLIRNVFTFVAKDTKVHLHAVLTVYIFKVGLSLQELWSSHMWRCDFASIPEDHFENLNPRKLQRYSHLFSVTQTTSLHDFSSPKHHVLRV